MKRFLILIVACGLSGARLAPAVPVNRGQKETTFVDLQPKANAKVKENFQGGTAGNNLAALPGGEQKLAGVRFQIGNRLIQLAGKGQNNGPDKVEGIKVGRAFTRLYILHATGTGWGTKDGEVIGKYVVHYADKKTATIEIAYGKDVRDWWYYANSPDVSRGKVAWKGENDSAKKGQAKIRLYLTTWKNPHPKKKVLSIDYMSTKTTPAAPFCVAMTAEGK
jgi:hypothetical protein